MSPRLVRWALICVAVIVAVALVSAFWNRLTSWLPWSAESRLARSEQARDHAESDAAARGLESQGNAEQVQRVETFHTQVVELRDLTSQAINEARSAPDATDPLPAERADRLRAADRRLCAVYYGCEASAPPAS